MTELTYEQKSMICNLIDERLDVLSGRNNRGGYSATDYAAIMYETDELNAILYVLKNNNGD